MNLDPLADDVDPDAPHLFVPMQLQRAIRCGVCNRPQHSTLHLERCPTCDRPLNLIARCPAGCLDYLDLDRDHVSPPTSRDRFGGRNR